jgi:hypothetical protein
MILTLVLILIDGLGSARFVNANRRWARKPETGISSIDGAQLSRFYVKMAT